MSSEVAIKLENVSKVYPIFQRPVDRLKQMLAQSRRKYYHEFWALKDINLEIRAGETFGLLGRNGSGKSTLLQIISGTLQATTGKIKTVGRIAALLELGSGFNPEFTGRENVHLNATILGVSPAELVEKFDAILEFADIGEFIDLPVKTYSSGMFARLAFSVASSLTPAILIIDEILAVGDAKFQARCFARLKELQKQGTTILLVTHSTEQIVTHCSRAALLDSGNLIGLGEAKSVANQYLDLLFGKGLAPSQEKVSPTQIQAECPVELANQSGLDLFSTRPGYNKYEYRWGDGKASILDYSLSFNAQKFPSAIDSQGLLELHLKIVFNAPIFRPIFGLTIKSKEGVTLAGSNSELSTKDTSVRDSAHVGEIRLVRFKLDFNLAPGDYFISLGVASMENETVVPHDRRYDSIHLHVSDKVDYVGLFQMPCQIDKVELP